MKSFWIMLAGVVTGVLAGLCVWLATGDENGGLVVAVIVGHMNYWAMLIYNRIDR